MKKVLALTLLLISTVAFGMEKSDEQAALSAVQRLRQLAEAKEKRSEQREQEELELKKQELALQERQVKALEVIATSLAVKFMEEKTYPEAKGTLLREKVEKLGLPGVPMQFLQPGHAYDPSVAGYLKIATFLASHMPAAGPAASEASEDEE